MIPNDILLDAGLITLLVLGVLVLRVTSPSRISPARVDPLVKDIDDAIACAGYRTADLKRAKGKKKKVPGSVKIVGFFSPNHVLGRLWLDGGPKDAEQAKFEEVWFLRAAESEPDVNELIRVVKQLRKVRNTRVEVKVPN